MYNNKYNHYTYFFILRIHEVHVYFFVKIIQSKNNDFIKHLLDGAGQKGMLKRKKWFVI